MLAALDVLAENNFGDTRAGDGLVGPLGLLVIVVLVIATIFLIRNMNKRLRRLPDRFPKPDEGDREGVGPDGEQAAGGPITSGRS